MTPLDALLAHADVARLATALALHPGREEQPEEGTRLAAIACVLRSGAGGVPELLMIKRAEVERDPWSGHIACPGGRHEPGDRDLEATALRETWEETGVDIARNGRVLGTLDDLHPRTPSLPAILIRPYVAVVRPDVEIVASPEVAEAFWVPLDALRERARWGQGVVNVRGVEREVSTFTHDSYTVWGLTERVLRNLMQRMDEV
ncbi:MAG: hydrolase [Gemmatimonadetes bacterium]|nr:hydrolase [Gemmatimonadota bacterium]